MADDLLNRLGTAAIQKLPGKLQQSMRGAQFRTVAPDAYHADGNYDSSNIAGVPIGNPNTVNVMAPLAFAKNTDQLVAHEGMHLWQNNLPPALAAKIPADNMADPYNFGGLAGLKAMRQRGGTILDLPKEQQAAMMQYRQSQGGDSAPANIRAVTDPFIKDMNALPLSQIMPTDPNQKGINTTPRAPLPPMQYAQNIYQKGQGPETAAPPPPPGFEPVADEATPPPPAGFEPIDIPDNSVTQTGPKTFQGPNVEMPYSFKSLAQGAGDFGKGAAKGAANTLFNVGANTPVPSYLSGSGFTDHANVGPKPDALNPQGTMQNLGYGAEQAGEFMLPAGLEGKAAEAVPFLGKTLPKIGMQALTSGAVNAAQGGSFKQGALAGGIAGGLGSAARGMAGTVAESALGVRNVDRGFSKTPGQAILNDTRGVRPSTIADSARGKIDTLTGRLEQAAANSGVRGSTDPAINVIDDAIVKKAAQNSPAVDDLQGLRNQLTVNRLTSKSIPTDQSATGLLNLKRGVNDTIDRWQPGQQKGIKGVSRQVYGALDKELDRTTPEAPGLNQRISSLIPVANRAEASDLNANMLQRSLGRFARPTGALAGAIAGGFYGYHHGGIGSALQDATLGIAVPEFLASPTTQMVGARALDKLGGPIARYGSGVASQLFRGKQSQ